MLSIAVVPDVTIVGGPEQFAVVDEQLLLTCRYSALPPVSEVQWGQNGTLIDRNSSVEINDSRVTILHYNESQVQLSITATTSRDAGNYTCIVINDIGNSSDTTSVISQGVFKCTKRREINTRVFVRVLFISVSFIFLGNVKFESEPESLIFM